MNPQKLTKEDYKKKTMEIFRLLNNFRKNPKLLVKHLEYLKKYVDSQSKILSEPGKIQVQMSEGEICINDAIEYLNKLDSLEPLILDDNLCKSAMEHVLDIGPKGILSYQSSNGLEPEERISKFGTYVDTLGENIDFGPNDAFGVIVSLCLDDGEPERPHRDNLFKSDYKKVGIACGPHKSEFQMCVMDFAFDFLPIETENVYENTQEKPNVNFVDVITANTITNNIQNPKTPAINTIKPQLQQLKPTTLGTFGLIKKDVNDFGPIVEDIGDEVRKMNLNISTGKIISKTIETITRVVYFYEDGTSKEVSDKKVSQTI